ncbi:MAG: tetratricopeptide repeat protein [Anaerolineae bacterium]|nr:tetratricopeptide repeat protein [Gemmatimonadaceae bacterium]
MTRTGASARPPMDLEERTDSIFYWIQSHTKQIGIAATILVLAAVGWWVYMRTQRSEEQRAEQMLNQARQSIAAGNSALAQSDLDKVVKRYPDAAAGRQAVLLLSEVLYRGGKFEQGIAELKKVATVRAGDDLASVAEGQIAVGYEELKKFAEAAEHYQKAAGTARFDMDRDLFLASAARAFTAAGNQEGARKIWNGLATNESGVVSGEARVRLGELNAKPAASR